MDSRANNVDFVEEPGSLQLSPLYELINGAPVCDMLNVQTRTDERSFELYSSKEIRIGGELFLNYGDKSPSHFARMYGICPEVYWKDPKVRYDHLLLKIEKRFLIHSNDDLRKSAVDECDCHLFKRDLMILAPSELREWEQGGKSPPLLRILILYLRIQAASDSQLKDQSFKDQLVMASRDVDFDLQTKHSLKKILNYNAKRIATPSASEVEDAQNPNNSISNKKRTSILMRMIAHDTIAAWKRNIEANYDKVR